MVFSGSAASQFNSTFGKVLAISPDTSTVIFSDTFDTPNQVFICNGCSTSSRSITPLLITGATAAAFSPDNLKAYIVANDIVAGNNLYVYSKVDALQKISLNPNSPANDVAFAAEGGFSYLAGGAPSSITVRRTCDNALDSSATLNTLAIPSMIRALPDATTLLALEPPYVDVINITALSSTGCTGTISDAVNAINLGQGTFVPTQFIISGDGSAVYILGETQPNSARLPFIIAFKIANQTTSSISLTGTAVPLSASLSPAGNLLFVGADDGAVHIIDTSSGSDLQQVTFPAQTPLCFGPGNPPTAVPKTVVAISAVSQNGSSTTYSYVVNSGPPLAIGETIVIAGMKDGGNDGTYTILTLGPGTFTVTNNSGVTTTSAQNGSGTVSITCNPDLVAVKP
jgi:WD40 repeat protein